MIELVPFPEVERIVSELVGHYDEQDSPLTQVTIDRQFKRLEGVVDEKDEPDRTVCFFVASFYDQYEHIEGFYVYLRAGARIATLEGHVRLPRILARFNYG